MNIDDMNPKFIDDMATEYLNGMYESQYDDDQSDGNPHTKVVTPEESKQINEDLPF
jgi:hypothetical protein